MSSLKVYQPEYYKDFKCIEDKCQNNCCHSWRILIDKNTYDKYMSYDEYTRNEFKNKTKVTCEDPFEAIVLFDDSGRCRFLNEHKLCDIQVRFGHDSLSSVCKRYPRLYFNVDGEIEAFLNVSCEAAAHISLLNPGIMRLEEALIGYDESINFDGTLDTSKYTPDKNGVEIFWKLRITSIFLIQNRRYKLWMRMVILGLFIKQSDEHLLNGSESEILTYADDFIAKVEKGSYDGFDKKIPNKHGIKIGFISYILNIVGNNLKNELLKDCIIQMKIGLGIDPNDANSYVSIDNYNEAYEEYYLPFFQDKEYILENYIINLIFMSGFPFDYKSEKSMFKNYMKLVIKYSIIKFLLIGIAGYYKHNFNNDIVIKSIASFSRLFDHDDKFMNDLVEYLEVNEAATLGTLCVFIKE